MQHVDKLGKDINVDVCVVFPAGNSLVVGKVIKLNPKMVGVETITKRPAKYNKYPRDCVVVNSEDVTVAILKGVL